uniref:Interleukin 11 receptor subunit alpha n=1 Tax=Xenopus tropicalis TaxID=8364 RepID=A0A803JTP2_XENTR
MISFSRMNSLASCLSRVIVLLAVTAVSLSVSSSKWGEEGVLYGKIGGNITLMCNASNDSLVAEWRFNGTPDISWGFFTDIGHLELPHAHHSATGNYSCYSHSGDLLSSVLLRMGYPPGTPSVFCRASDYENFSCFWKSSVETLLPTRFTASYRSRNHMIGVCLQEPVRPNMCSVRKSEFWSSYQMNITEENPLGSSFRLLDVTMQSIVKPDPPENLLVEPIPFAPRRLRVSWDYPSTWPKEPHFQLKFRVQYRPVQHPLWSEVETANLSDIITDAFAGMEHVIQVSAKDFLDAGNWSDWSVEVRATPWTSMCFCLLVEEQWVWPMHCIMGMFFLLQYNGGGDVSCNALWDVSHMPLLYTPLPLLGRGDIEMVHGILGLGAHVPWQPLPCTHYPFSEKHRLISLLFVSAGEIDITTPTSEETLTDLGEPQIDNPIGEQLVPMILRNTHPLCILSGGAPWWCPLELLCIVPSPSH